jgi:Cys-rich protein (TIGR01571 family)
MQKNNSKSFLPFFFFFINPYSYLQHCFLNNFFLIIFTLYSIDKMTTAEIQQSNELPPPAYQDDSDVIIPTEKPEEEEEEIDYSVTDKLIEDRAYYDNASAAEPTVSRDGNFELSLLDTVKRPDVFCPSLMFEPCIFARSNRAFLRAPEDDPAEIGGSWNHYVNGDCMAYSILAFWSHSIGNIVWRAHRRYSIRMRYQIEGSCVKDLAATAFCSPCALAQEDYEVRIREQETYNTNFKQGQQQLASENLV